MFFDEKFVTSNTLKRVWKSANNQPDVERNEDCCLPKLCSKLKRWMKSDKDDPRTRLSLRSSSALIGGTAKIYQQEMKKLVEDVCKLDEDLTFHKRKRHDSFDTFSDRSNQPSESFQEKISAKKSAVSNTSTYSSTDDYEDVLGTEDHEGTEFQSEYEESSSSSHDTGSDFNPGSNNGKKTSDSTSESLDLEINTSDSTKQISPEMTENNDQTKSVDNNDECITVQEFTSSSLDFDILENVVAEVMAEKEKDNSSTNSDNQAIQMTKKKSPEIMLRQTEQNINVSIAFVDEDSIIVKSPVIMTTKKRLRLNKSNDNLNSNDDDDIQEMEYCEEEGTADDETSDKEDNDDSPKVSESMSESTTRSLEEETNSSDTYKITSQRNREIQSFEREHRISSSFRQTKQKSRESVCRFPTEDSQTLLDPRPNGTALTAPELDTENDVRRKENLSHNLDDDNAASQIEVDVDNQEAISTTYSEIKDQATQTSVDEDVFDPNSPFGLVMIYDNYLSRIPSKIIFSSLTNDALNF